MANFPFPCIGEFYFLEFGISKHPRFHDVVSLLIERSNITDQLEKSPTSTLLARDSILESRVHRPNTCRILDLGTCLGQDLRAQRYSGVPVSALYGTDIFAEFETIGHHLFLDQDTFAHRFFASDVFDDGPQAPVNMTSGLWDIVSASMFTHQFDLDTQRMIARRMIRLLRSSKGCMIIGTSTGQLEARSLPLRPPFCRETGDQTVYRHSRETMHFMWLEVLKACGEDHQVWRIDFRYDDAEILKFEKEREHERDIRFFQGDGQRRIHFTIERI